MVRQRGGSSDGAYARISTNPTDSRSKGRHRRRSRASNPEWEIEESGFKQAVPSFPAVARLTEGAFGVGLRG
jgi:hypothetical protein